MCRHGLKRRNVDAREPETENLGVMVVVVVVLVVIVVVVVVVLVVVVVVVEKRLGKM